MKLIGLTGPAGSGKSTAANSIEALARNEGFAAHRYSFAEPLKRGVEVWINNRDEVSQDKETLLPYFNMTRREIWQQVGTEVARNIDSNFWLNVAKLHLGTYGDADFVIIDDVRFENEALWLRAFPGFLLHINRPHNPTKVPAHASEKGVGLYRADWIVHNDGMESEFVRKIRQLTPALLQEVSRL